MRVYASLQTCPDRLCPGFGPFLGARNTALWEFQVQHQGELPSEPDHAVELEAIQGTLISERIANTTLLKGSSKDLIALVQLFQLIVERLRRSPTLGRLF